MTLEFVQWRIYVGPPFRDPDDLDYYDWSQLTSGVASSFSVKSLLDANLSASGTSMTLVNANAFPTKGGAWVGPFGSGEGWEYVTYTGKGGDTLTGLTREPTAKREHSGVHSSPADVLMWWEIKDNDGKLHVTRQMSDDWASITWNADIAGVNIPTVALRNNHVVVIQMRTDPSVFFTNYLVGFFDSPQGKDDYQNYGEWTVKVICSADIAAKIEVGPYKSGDLDMAKNGSAQGSQALTGTCKERPSGDFTAANPSFDAESTIDDKESTLWIAERLVGDNDNDPYYNITDSVNFGGLRFSQLYFNPPVGSIPGSRWIELTMLTGTFRGQSIWTAIGGMINGQYDENASYGWILTDMDATEMDRIILCESEEAYTAQNPLSEHAIIQENKEFFQYIRPEGGELWMRLGQLNLWQARVRWGDAYGGVLHEDLSPTERQWDGPTLPVPGKCQTLNYIYNPSPVPSNAAGYWELVTDRQHFGYEIHSDENAPWIKIELPGIGLKLPGDITASVPGVGGLLAINDASGPSTAGLPTSGKIKIGDEVMSYSSRVETGVYLSGRGIDGSTAAIHRKDDEIYFIDPLNNFATDGPPINKIQWFRQNGTIYPKNFELWVSNLIEARTPDQDDWQEDYVNLHNVLDGSASSYSATFTTRRIKNFIFKFNQMTTDPARPRINQIKAWADPEQYGANWLKGEETVGDLVYIILRDAHMPVGSVDRTAVTDPVPDGETAKGNAWALVSDLMEYTSHRIECKLDSKFIITPDNTWVTPTFSPTRTWTKANAVSIEPVWANTNGVSQVSLKWELNSKADEGTVNYPATPDLIGSVAEIGPYVYATETAATLAAKRRFYQGRYPYTIVVSCAEFDPFIVPGEIHRVQWKINPTMPEMDRIYVVTAVDQMIENNIGTTTLTMTEIGREQN